MALLLRRFSVSPNWHGFLFNKNVLERELSPGMYFRFDPLHLQSLYLIPTCESSLQITNQEVLTKDNAAFRFSAFVRYIVTSPSTFITHVPVQPYLSDLTPHSTSLAHIHAQTALRDRLSTLDSDQVNEARATLCTDVLPILNSQLSRFGIEVRQLSLIDLTFPKRIQDLLIQQIESKVRAKADLENARTAVAAARAMKNASELMKGDESLRFLQLMETMKKIAGSGGRHTFVVGANGAYNMTSE